MIVWRSTLSRTSFGIFSKNSLTFPPLTGINQPIHKVGRSVHIAQNNQRPGSPARMGDHDAPFSSRRSR